MEQRVEIKRNAKAFELRFKLFSAAFIGLSILIIFLTFNFSRTINLDEIIDILFTGIIFCCLYLISASLLWKQWQGIKYYITPNAIIVKRKIKGLFSNYVEEIYTLKNIKSARITQSHYAQKNNFGDIILFILHEDNQVVLQDIDQPQSLSTNISKSIGITTMQDHKTIH